MAGCPAMSSRRDILRRLLRTLLGAGAALASPLPTAAVADAIVRERRKMIEDPARRPGLTFSQIGDYGKPSSFENASRRRLTRNNLLGAALCPLQDSRGTLTPSALHYQVNRAGVAVIDPRSYRLTIHGLVRYPKVFTMSDLKRFPAVTRTHFIECSDNGFSEWERPTATDIQGTHGLTSNSQWVGVRLATVLGEVGVRGIGKWILAEGGDGSGLMRSIPMDKAMNDALLVYAQNGEALRPEQGYPLRLLLPGFEGNMNIKWLRRLEIGDRPWMTRSETTAYTDLLPGGKARIFSFVMEAKSVITFPSAGIRLKERGFYEIRGLAWSGRGRILKVEVSTDGGGRWVTAQLDTPVLSKAHTRFRVPWHWQGQAAVLKSRAIDETGYMQPTLGELVAARGTKSVNHNNAIQSWGIAADGSVSNIHDV